MSPQISPIVATVRSIAPWTQRIAGRLYAQNDASNEPADEGRCKLPSDPIGRRSFNAFRVNGKMSAGNVIRNLSEKQIWNNADYSEWRKPNDPEVLRIMKKGGY